MAERMRDADVNRWIDAGLRNLRYAARVLRRNPGFTAVVVLSMALGIGANTAVFSLLNAVVLKSLPVRNPEELVILEARVKGPGADRTPSRLARGLSQLPGPCRAVHRAVHDLRERRLSRHCETRPNRSRSDW